ncbi:CPBP family intramembrane glutamic endopeptidase [Lentilactobacillus sp. Marseille-Q4993]|uniref:CPBP family intramembrane glutamic endopeptidase n=1 Tax=Lentilactobacillus sp. Marseille-Q4993 TaxID=3039492 RepID=UPI0024BC0542|nr:CPBP family intramembrane glutamic endopeptidase [Lentilactobacillus sp. Marseille-Q4993]
MQFYTKKTTINWGKTIIAVLIPFMELFLSNFLAENIVKSMVGRQVMTVLIFTAGFLLAIYLYRDVLAKDWKVWRRHWIRNGLLAIVGVIVIMLILNYVRVGINKLGLVAGGGSLELLSINSSLMMLFGSLTSLMAPFTEEIIFRHVLFYQFKGRSWAMIIMFFVQSIAFGLVHWNNFNGVIVQMIPYMFVGAFFGLVYYFSKNIWQSIMTHFLFDFMNFMGAVIVVVMQLINH